MAFLAAKLFVSQLSDWCDIDLPWNDFSTLRTIPEYWAFFFTYFLAFRKNVLLVQIWWDFLSTYPILWIFFRNCEKLFEIAKKTSRFPHFYPQKNGSGRSTHKLSMILMPSFILFAFNSECLWNSLNKWKVDNFERKFKKKYRNGMKNPDARTEKVLLKSFRFQDLPKWAVMQRVAINKL